MSDLPTVDFFVDGRQARITEFFNQGAFGRIYTTSVDGYLVKVAEPSEEVLDSQDLGEYRDRARKRYQELVARNFPLDQELDCLPRIKGEAVLPDGSSAPCYLMKRARGQPLNPGSLNPGKWNLPTAMRVEAAYRKLHSLGVVQVDVKLDNIIRLSSGDVRLIDVDGGALRGGFVPMGALSDAFAAPEIYVPGLDPQDFEGHRFAEHWAVAVLLYRLLVDEKGPFPIAAVRDPYPANYVANLGGRLPEWPRGFQRQLMVKRGLTSAVYGCFATTFSPKSATVRTDLTRWRRVLHAWASGEDKDFLVASSARQPSGATDAAFGSGTAWSAPRGVPPRQAAASTAATQRSAPSPLAAKLATATPSLSQPRPGRRRGSALVLGSLLLVLFAVVLMRSTGRAPDTRSWVDVAKSGAIDVGAEVELIRSFRLGGEVNGIASGDLDGDGRSDVVAAVYGSDRVAVLRNSGSPSGLGFEDPWTVNVPAAPEGVAVADLDGDGLPDIVVASAGGNAVSVVRNQSSPGALNFAASETAASLPTPHRVVLADLDGDGDADMVVTSNSGRQVLLLSNETTVRGQIAFELRAQLPIASFPDPIAVADLDNDGRPDIILPVQDSNAVFFFRNESVGGRLTFREALTVRTGKNPATVAVTDVNGDGRPDVVTGNEGGDSLTVLINAGGSAGIAFAKRQDVDAGPGPSVSALGPTDGRLAGVLVTHARADYGTVLEARKDRPLQATISVPIGAGSWFSVVDDFDNDGMADFAVVSGEAVVFLRSIQGSSPAVKENATGSLSCTPSALHSGQTLTLSMPRNHGRELGVATPDGFLFIAFRPEGTTGAPIPSSVFLELSEVTLGTSAVGMASIGGEPQQIFSRPGRYEFVVSQNLETEDDAGVNLHCAIEYVPTVDPSSQAVDSLLARAESLFSQRRYSEAQGLCRQALALEPGNARAKALARSIENTVAVLGQ